MIDIDTPVLIVGGGGFGLVTSIFLSNLGVESVLVERHENPSPMPKARYLNQRTMEIFRQHDLAHKIYDRAVPIQHMSTTRWVTSLGGSGPHDQTLLYEMDVFGGGSLATHYKTNSPCESAIYPQVRLEPLMREHAETQSQSHLLFNHALVNIEQRDTGVIAQIQDRSSGLMKTVRARYVIAADGGKTIGPLVGAKFEGTAELMDMVTVYFRADLSAYLDNDDSFAYWMANPGGDSGSWGSGVLGKLGPTHFDRHSEEWMFHFSFNPDDPARFEESSLVPKMRALMKIPDLNPEVLGIGRWTVQGVLADRYRFGNIFLGGDAAHRHPPTTGLGLNSAVQDAHNLAWKLAQVLQGKASDDLLDSYETERRPAAQRNVDWALFTFSNHQLTGSAIGLVAGDIERSRANFEALLADTFDGETRRNRFREVMKQHSTEYQANDLEIGVQYESGAFISDGTLSLVRDPTGRQYIPTTRPGARLPHAWLERDGQPVSTLDLVPCDGFLLLIDRESKLVAQVLEIAAAYSIRVDVVIINDGAAVSDPRQEWHRIKEIGEGGAVLIRPDQIVAWRAISASDCTSQALRVALEIIMCKEKDAGQVCAY